MAEESGKKEDLELTPEKAGDVKGGALRPEPGATTRKLSVKHSTKKGVKGPVQKLPHQ